MHRSYRQQCVLVGQANGSSVTAIEDIAKGDELHPMAPETGATRAGDLRVAATGASQSGVMRVAEIEATLKADWSPPTLDPIKLPDTGMIADVHGSAAYRANRQGDGPARHPAGGLIRQANRSCSNRAL